MKTPSDEIKVYFGRPDSLREPPPPNSILIVPDRDKWNDFKLRTRVEIHVTYGDLKKPYVTYGHIGFISSMEASPDGVDQLNQIVEELGELVVPADNKHFFTMLPTMEAYRDVVRHFSLDGAEAVLMAVRDLVVMNELKPSSNWIEAAIQTKAFSKSFIRDSEAYFAYKNASSVLRGLELEELGRLSQALAIRFQLAGCVGPHALSFNFDHSSALPKRIAVLIGKNGVGKSQALLRIARAALNGTPELTDGETGGRPLISRMLAFAPSNEAGSVFPVEKRKMPRIWYKRFSMSRARSAKRGDGISDLIIQIARSFQSIREKSRWEIFLDAIKGINAHEQLCLVTRDPLNPYLKLNELLRTNEERRLERFASVDLRREPVRVVGTAGYPLSSGEISFLKFAAQGSLHIENGSLLLLDEPETHLHPNFISGFISLLEHLLAMTGSSAIIATHSAYIVREVFREQVTVLRFDENNMVKSERPRLRTFGSDVGAISYFVFGEDEPSKLAHEVKERLMQSGRTWDQIFEQYDGELSYEFLMDIRSSIEERGSHE